MQETTTQPKDRIKKIQRNANIGFYGSLVAGIATLVFHQFCHYRFYVNNYGHRLMLIGGVFLTVMVVGTILLSVRRTLPQIWKLDSVDERLKRYTDHLSTLFRSSLAVAIIDCALIVLSGDSILFMLLMILILTLMMLYPSRLKMKVDLGLTDEQYDQLFGQE